MRVRTAKDGFCFVGRYLPTGSLYVNEPNRLTCYVADFTLYVGAKSGNMYIKGFIHDSGRWNSAVFFETGTIFINNTRFGGGRFPEIFYDFSRKFPQANKPIPAKLAGMQKILPSTPRSRVADITPMNGTAYSLKKHNADNADRWTFGGKPTSIGTDTPCYAATGKVDRTVSKPPKKDYTPTKPAISFTVGGSTGKVRSKYLAQFNTEDWAEVIFRDSMSALHGEMCR